MPQISYHSHDGVECLVDRVLVKFIAEALKVFDEFLDSLVAVGEDGKAEGQVAPLPLCLGHPEPQAQLLHQGFQVLVLFNQAEKKVLR